MSEDNNKDEDNLDANTLKNDDDEMYDTERLKVQFGKWSESCLAAASIPTRTTTTTGGGTTTFDQYVGALVREATQFFENNHPPPRRDQSLALLLQSLEQSFTGKNLKSRKTALLLVQGSLSIPQQQQQECSIALSLEMMKLLGNFLLQHCGPILMEEQEELQVNDVDSDDWDEQVRDSAIQTISSLLLLPTTTTTTTTSPNPSNSNSILSIQYRIQLSQEALRRRCAIPDHEPDNNEGDEDLAIAPRGLASLSRSRRSFCFQLLQSTLQGLKPLLEQLEPQSQPQQNQPQPQQNHDKQSHLDSSGNTTSSSSYSTASLVSWVELAIHCLHGESDPRCLMQLFILLADIQRSCYPILQKSFPLDALTDAVAAYYPIHFNPPPNALNLVTKDQLVQALWNILSFTKYDSTVAGNETTMFSFTLNLILDQLLPMEGDDPPTLEETRNALMDLKKLFMVEEDDSTQVSAISQKMVDPKALGQVVLALKKSLGNSPTLDLEQGAPLQQQQQHQVSRQCRTLISAIAWSCEQQQQDDSRYWQIFVQNVVLEVISNQSNQPLSRSNIVYLSCLAGCGGPKTMQYVLDQCLPFFFNNIPKTSDTERLFSLDPPANDEEEEDDFGLARRASFITTSCYGIAALLAAVQTSLQRLLPLGLSLTPHPLQSHATFVLEALLNLWRMTTLTMENGPNYKRVSLLHLAIIQAMETAILVLPDYYDNNNDNSTLDQQQFLQVPNYLQNLCEFAIWADRKIPVEDPLEGDMLAKQLIAACSKSLGIILGQAFAANQEPSSAQESSIVRSNSKIGSELRDHILSSLLLQITSSSSSSRGHLLVLSTACRSNRTAAGVIVNKLTEIWMEQIQNRDTMGEVSHLSRKSMEEIAAVLKNGGRHASEAFQQSDFLFRLRTVVLPQRSGKQVGLHSNVASILALPLTREEIAREEAEIAGLHTVLETLVPIYSAHVDPKHLRYLFSATSKVVPPLDSNDRKRFSALIILLSAALQNSSKSTLDSSGELDEMTVREMVSFLPELILSNAVSPSVRFYVISCLNSLLAKFLASDAECCPCLQLLELHVMPTIVKLFNDLKTAITLVKDDERHETVQETLKGLELAFSFTGSIAFSAVQRLSGLSSLTADKAVTFLVDIACSGKAETVTSRKPTVVDVSVADIRFPKASEYLRTAAALAFGSIVSSGPHDILWKQRLSLVAWKRIQQSMDVLSVGLIGTSAFILCSNKWVGLPSTMSSALTEVILRGLSMETVLPGAVKKVLLAAVVKLLSIKNAFAEEKVLSVVAGVLRSYATTDSSDKENILPCKLLALQALQNIPTLITKRGPINAVKPAIISILEQAMSDKSNILRYAAVEVRNTWFVV